MEKEYLTKETKSIKNNALKTLVIVLITAALIAPSVYSAPPSRQLTEIETNDYGTDNLATFITNSNGNYWEETGVNLYTALGGAGGDIIAYIPGNAHPYPNGHEFYVNGSYGSDTNLGNIDSPFATIQYGVGMLRAGDTLFIRGGTYVENYVKLNHSHGSIDNYITIKPYNDEDVKLKATITINDSYFIKIEGLQIYDTPSYGIGGSLGYAGEEIHNIIIDNCLINNTFNAGIYLNGIDEWNTIDSIQITNNELHHLNTGGSNEGIAPNYCSNITISNNYLYDCYKEMIALDTCSYATVNNNIINMTEPSDDTYSQCIGIRSNSFSGGNITDINVSNNWIWGNHTNVGIEIIGFENPSSPGSHSKIYCYNNIISGTARGIDIMGSDSTPEWANKINNVSIVHNTIYNTSGAGIRFNDSVNDESDIDNLTVMNNIMVHKDGHFGFINYPSSDIDLNNFSVDYNFFTMNISGYHTSGGSHPGSNNVNEWSESDWGYDIFKKASTNHNKIGIYYEDLSLIATCNATDAGGDLYDWYSDYLGNTRLINNRDIGAFERNDAVAVPYFSNIMVSICYTKVTGI
ncbi:MAG: right-handed parallel beta-helix repeat-containing protein, partial [Bacteroidota bacterium]|nr:right-handed parallel beta-helix repeat-containing protein [Bacteroidota bacterium]